jgi:hypothetical protein
MTGLGARLASVGFAVGVTDILDDDGTGADRGPLGRRFSAERGFVSCGDDDAELARVTDGEESSSDDVD